MVCPVCGEPLDLEGYEAGDLLDCEACGAGDEVVLRFSDGTLEEEVRALKADPLEALRRLEEGVGEEAPKEAEDGRNLEPDYLTVHVETDGGPLALRRVVFPGAPDLLEFTLPSGSVYEFPFRQVVKTLRPILL
ncbi:hypothetical protein BVI061214_00693 [Thermus aquaticus]|uniref:Uncharacterized protein n=1 Tax=Thermus aquaticus TaxID=271 RepID=A0A0M9AF08_THEAQ|nr:hypothetical protein [Thermus aquaticus]KOX89525.1 hypothetical protein BVI061214_00693 [Thermus aquaticus]